MNICFFTHYEVNPQLGGIERVTYNLFQYFISQDINVFFFHKHGKESNNHFILPQTTNIQELSEFILSKTRKKQIQIIIDQYGSEPVFSHEYLPNDIKIIRCLHLNIKENHITRCLLEPYKYKNKKELLRNFLYWINTPRRRFKLYKSYEYCIQNVDTFLLLSESYKHELSKIFPTNNIKAINNAIVHLPTDASFIKEKENIIMFCGRIVHNPKNILFLIYLWKHLFRKFTDWEMVIVGDGEDKYILEHLIKKERLERITLVGNTNPTDYYKKAKIFVLPSYNEGFAVVLLEAMAYACIPIVFDSSSAFKQIIENQKNGYIIPNINKKDFIAKCESIMSNEKKRIRMQQECLEKIKDFTIDKIGKQWIDLFNDLIK